MEDVEVPIEKIQENILEEAEHTQVKWISWVALSSALVAVMAAVAALQAGHHSNEALVEQIQSSDRWAYYQAKGIKSSVLVSKTHLLQELGKKVSKKDLEKIEEYKKEQDEISKEAKVKEKISVTHLHIHEVFAKAVTLFQISIAVAAISILIKRKRFWFLSLGFAVFAIFFFIQGFLVKIGDHLN